MIMSHSGGNNEDRHSSSRGPVPVECAAPCFHRHPFVIMILRLKFIINHVLFSKEHSEFIVILLPVFLTTVN